MNRMDNKIKDEGRLREYRLFHKIYHTGISLAWGESIGIRRKGGPLWDIGDELQRGRWLGK